MRCEKNYTLAMCLFHDLSRFGRNKEEIKDEWESLMKDEIDIVVLNMPIPPENIKSLKGWSINYRNSSFITFVDG